MAKVTKEDKFFCLILIDEARLLKVKEDDPVVASLRMDRLCDRDVDGI